ncbi:MAG TPA: IS5 family transposase [Rhodocyclaceae bacterium]|nr:IS5 family transposase [Rhodocyclaceae bacterium]
MGDASRGSAKSGQTRPVGVLHRRDLRSREKGGSGVGKTKRGKGTKIMAVADRIGLPIAVHTESASPHEVTLVQATLEQSLLGERPTRLIGDKAYDSDTLDAKLAQQGIELIAPHRSNRNTRTQDGRVLRRYVRRWKIERLFAWLGNFRRLLHRWEYYLENYTGLVQLGCMLILLRNYF